MNILIDENCRWLKRDDHLWRIDQLNSAGHDFRFVGDSGCPELGAKDARDIIPWLTEHDFGILTHDFDDFRDEAKAQSIHLLIIAKIAVNHEL